MGMAITEREVVRLGKNGRIVIPAHLREKLGLREGEEIILSSGPDGIILCSAADARRNAQRRMMKYRKKGRSAVDEFIAERRKEADRE